MPVSFSGLDLSWLKNPENRLPPQPAKVRVNFRAKRSDTVACPAFMPDITPYVNVATRDQFEMTSRSQQREFEKRSGLVQVGTDLGDFVAENNAQREKWRQAAEGHATGPQWTDE